jgi:hypothetical protein
VNRRVILAALLAFVTACGDATGPSPLAAFAGSWHAVSYLTDGGEWNWTEDWFADGRMRDLRAEIDEEGLADLIVVLRDSTVVLHGRLTRHGDQVIFSSRPGDLAGTVTTAGGLLHVDIPVFPLQGETYRLIMDLERN